RAWRARRRSAARTPGARSVLRRCPSRAAAARPTPRGRRRTRTGCGRPSTSRSGACPRHTQRRRPMRCSPRADPRPNLCGKPPSAAPETAAGEPLAAERVAGAEGVPRREELPPRALVEQRRVVGEPRFRLPRHDDVVPGEDEPRCLRDVVEVERRHVLVPRHVVLGDQAQAVDGLDSLVVTRHWLELERPRTLLVEPEDVAEDAPPVPPP